MATAVSLANLADGTITKVMLGEAPVVVVKFRGAVRAFDGRCPHAGAPLEQGAVCDGRLVCPWHKATFRIEDGAVVEPPALVDLTPYTVSPAGEVALESPQEAARRVVPKKHSDRVAAIIGSGAAGAAAASALRRGGFGGRVVMLGDEASLPYDRTTLSKFVVAGEMSPAQVPRLRDAKDWDTIGVERCTTRVRTVVAPARRIEFADGTSMTYDTALVALGSIANRLDVPGTDLAGVQTLRSLHDAAAILADNHSGGRAVIMGSSFIGLEVASCLRKRGVGVTIVTPEAEPFTRQFGREIGSFFRQLHETNGVTFHSGAEVVALQGDARVRQVALQDGARLETDSVVIGVGVRPASDVVEGVEKAEDGGLIVDASMRATGTLFAAGDCATFPFKGRAVRIEHWRVAQQQGCVAAAGMTGHAAHYDAVPFFWTYHYGQRYEYLGHPERWEEMQIDGELASHNFIAYQVLDRHVVGVIACGRERATATLVERMRAPLTLADARGLVARH